MLWERRRRHMDLKNWYDRVREQLDRLDFPAL